MRAEELELSVLKAIGSELQCNAELASRAIEESMLHAQDFSDPRNAALFEAMSLRARERRALDSVEMIASLPGVPRERVIDVATSGEFGMLPGRAERLRDWSLRRRTAAELERAIALLRDTRTTVPDAVGRALHALESSRAVRPAHRSGMHGLVGLVDHVEQVALGNREPVLQTGIPALDVIIGGLQRTLTVIGAMPAVGKSALVASMVRNLALAGRRVGVVSLEDEDGWIQARMVAERSRIPLPVLLTKKLSDNQHERFGAATCELREAASLIHIDDRSGLTTSEVLESAREMILSGVEAVFIDHLGEIRLERSDRHDLDISLVLSELRALAKSRSVPVVVLCHVRRRTGLAEASDEPCLSDFAFSAGVERISRVALGLSRPDEQTLRVHVLKQTRGQANVSVDLPFNAPSGMVENGASQVADVYAQQEREMLARRFP